MGKATRITYSLAVLSFFCVSCAAVLPPVSPTTSYSLPTFPARWVEVDGLRIRTLETGAGAPVLFLHGALGSAQSWCKNMGELAKEYHVIALDFPGFGESQRGNNPCTLESFTLFLRHFIEKEHLSRPSLIGISLGGNVALNYALLYPGEVSHLILISPTGAGKLHSVFTEFLYVLLWHKPLLEAYLTPHRIKEIWNEQYAIATDLRDAVFEQRKEFQNLQRRKLFVSSFHAIVNDIKHRTLRDELGKIDVHTLIVWGKRDYYHSPKEGELLAQKMPRARFVPLDCGHTVMLDLPAPFNRLVLDFLHQQEN